MAVGMTLAWIGHKNLGDEACFYALRELLEPEVQMVPLEDHKIVGYCDLPDILLFSGGSILHPGLDLRMGIMHKLMSRGCPVAFLGSGVVVEPSRPPHELSPHVKHCLEHELCHPVGLRGPLSYQRLSEQGFTKGKIIGDPGMLLNPPSDSQEYDRHSKTIAINVGDCHRQLIGMDEEHMMSEVAKLVQALRDFRITYFPMWNKDVPYLEKMREMTGIGEVLPWRESPWDLMKFFRTCYCVIGQKLHASVLAAAAGVPLVSISYWEKNLDFCHSIDLQDFSVTTDHPNLGEELYQRFLLIPPRLDEILTKLRSKKAEFLALHRWTAEEVKKVACRKK